MGVKLPPRICLGFTIVLVLSVVILWFAWNMTCSVQVPGSIGLLDGNNSVKETIGGDGWNGDRVTVDIYYEVGSPLIRGIWITIILLYCLIAITGPLPR